MPGADTPLSAETNFILAAEKWTEFVAALDAPPMDLPRLRDLLGRLSVFVESEDAAVDEA